MIPQLVYRRDTPLLRGICGAVGYHGRCVWLVVGLEVPILEVAGTPASDIHYDLIDIRNLPYQIVKTPTRKVTLDSHHVLTAKPLMRNRRREMFFFISPALSRARQWRYANSNRLGPEEYAVLQGRVPFDAATMRVAWSTCIHRGLVSPVGGLTAFGRKMLKLRSGRKAPESKSN